MPDASCHEQFGSLCMRIETKNLLTFGIQKKTYGLSEISQAFLLGFALPIRTGTLEAGSPIPSLVGFSLMQDRRQLLHGRTVAFQRRWAKGCLPDEIKDRADPYKIARMG
jgi:hypothetical protein